MPEHKLAQTGVAVVGGGVAGLTAACFLARGGLEVAVFEKAPEPGGLGLAAPGPLHRDEQLAQQGRELLSVLTAQGAEQPLLPFDVRLDGLLYHLESFLGEGYQHAAPVVGVRGRLPSLGVRTVEYLLVAAEKRGEAFLRALPVPAGPRFGYNGITDPSI